MWKLRLIGLSIVFLCLMFAAGCPPGTERATPAAAPPPRVASQATPKDAFRKAFNSIHRGDKRGILASIYGVGGDRKTVEALAEFAEAARDFDAAFQKKFGRKEGEDPPCSLPGADIFEETIRTAEVRIDGDKASLGPGDDPGSVHFVKKGGIWKMLAADVIGIMQCSHIKNPDVVWNHSATTVRSCIGEIDKPGATREEVKRKLQEQLDKVSEIAELKEDYAWPPPERTTGKGE